MGTGINKIESLLKENGNLEPQFEFNSFYTIIFKRINGGIKSNEEMLLEIIIKNPGKRTTELAGVLNAASRTVEKWIKNLKDKEKIEYIGSKKTGGYFVKEN